MRCSVRAGARARGCFVPLMKRGSGGHRADTFRPEPGARCGPQPRPGPPCAPGRAASLERAPQTEDARLFVSPELSRRGRAGGAPRSPPRFPLRGGLGPHPAGSRCRPPPRVSPVTARGGRVARANRRAARWRQREVRLGWAMRERLRARLGSQPVASCMERGGSSQLDPGFSQQDTPLLIVEDSQPQGGAEADAERAWLGVLASQPPARRSPSPVLVSARRGGSTTRPCPARPGSDAAPASVLQDIVCGPAGSRAPRERFAGKGGARGSRRVRVPRSR